VRDGLYEPHTLRVISARDAEILARDDESQEYYEVEGRLGTAQAVEIAKRCGGAGAFLPHSCDAWVIGGPDQIRALIADLESALQTLAPPPPYLIRLTCGHEIEIPYATEGGSFGPCECGTILTVPPKQ
jgi:hypothetical protein